MISSLFTVLAEGISIDQKTNNMSIFNLFEDIGTIQLPMIVPKIIFVCSLAKEIADPDDLDVEIRFILNGNITLRQNTRITFTGKPKTRLIAELLGTEIREAGTFRVEALAAGNILGGSSLNINLLTQLSQTSGKLLNPS